VPGGPLAGRRGSRDTVAAAAPHGVTGGSCCPEAGAASSVRVYRWADLAGGQAVTGAEIGRVTARLHQVPWAGRGMVLCTGRRARLAGLAHRRPPRGCPWAGALGRWLPELIALNAAVAPPDPARMRTCHRDLNTENVLRAAGGGVIVLDWENSGPAQPERELLPSCPTSQRT
jgi:aminoglycoside phosphotransferase (APT) family kinase protein